jgi:hypothetical protein
VPPINVPNPEQTPATPTSPEAQLAAFIAKYTPEIAALAGEALARMRSYLPGANELVYDNYHALAIGFGPSERASEAIFSIALYPRWVSLFFLQGSGLPDPNRILQGTGTAARHLILKSPDTLDEPAVQILIEQALLHATVPIDPTRPGRLLIKSVSEKQRPRRPV